MAYVSIGPPDQQRLRESDRGQLLIVAGLVMAVSLVALVVLLNATIYSENVATRGIEPADGEATEMRSSAVEGVGETIDAVNRVHDGSDAPTSDVLAGVDELEERLSLRSARRGGLVGVETGPDRVTNGTRLDTTGNDSSLANATNATSYEFAGEIDRTRAFSIDVDIDGLAEATPSSASEDAFHFVIDPDGNESREVYLYADSDDVVVAIGDDGVDPTVACRLDPDGAERVTVDITGEELNGSPCPGIWPSDRVDLNDERSIRVENGDAAAGEIRSTVRPVDTEAGVATDVAAEDVAGAVYDLTIDLRYDTAELWFETTVRVAPGEPDV